VAAVRAATSAWWHRSRHALTLEMRFALLAFLFATPSFAACAAPAYWVGGTADYATTPAGTQEPGSSGALSLKVLACPSIVALNTRLVRRPALVRLGDACVLDVIRGGGTCALPTRTGPIRITVEHVSEAFTAYGGGYRRPPQLGPPLNVVIGGTAADGRYVTYRFTGGDMQTANDAECEVAARTLPQRAEPAPHADDVDDVSERSWPSGTESGPPVANRVR
jgi:hypothetical protein